MDRNNHNLHQSGSQAYPDRPLRMQKKDPDLPSGTNHDAYPDLPDSFRAASSSWEPFTQASENAGLSENNPYSASYHARLKNAAPSAPKPDVQHERPAQKATVSNDASGIRPSETRRPEPKQAPVRVPAGTEKAPVQNNPVKQPASKAPSKPAPVATDTASVRSRHDDLKLPPMTRVVTPVQGAAKAAADDDDYDYYYGEPEPVKQVSQSRTLSNPVVRSMPQDHSEQMIRAASAPAIKQVPSSGTSSKRRSTQKTKRNNTLVNIALVFFIFVFLFSLILLLLNLLPRMKARSEYLDLTPERLAKKGTVSVSDSALKEESESIAPVITQEMLDYYASVNPDFIGWLDVPGTNIHYPMVQGDSNDYYLHHTFKDVYSDYGSIFMDVNNAADFSDDNSVLYGHNMRSGAMFHDLNTMNSDSDYAREHMYYTITTPDGTVYTYQIFSVYRVSVDTDYRTPNIGNDADRIEYFYRLQGYSSVSLDRVSFRENDRIVTFSTCPPDSADDYRVAVHALLIKTEHI